MEGLGVRSRRFRGDFVHAAKGMPQSRRMQVVTERRFAHFVACRWFRVGAIGEKPESGASGKDLKLQEPSFCADYSSFRCRCTCSLPIIAAVRLNFLDHVRIMDQKPARRQGRNDECYESQQCGRSEAQWLRSRNPRRSWCDFSSVNRGAVLSSGPGLPRRGPQLPGGICVLFP